MNPSTILTSLLTETLFSGSTLLLTFVIILLYFWINSGPSEKEIFAKRNVKNVSFGNVFFLMLRKIRIERHRDEIFKKEGDVLGSMQMRKPTIFIMDPELCQQVMSKNFTIFTNRRTIKIADTVFKHGLFMIEDEKWKRCRSIMTPTFSMGKLKLMKPILNKTAKTFINNLNNAIIENNGKSIELKHFCGAFTMDSIIQIAFGIKVDSLEDRNNPLLKHAKSIFQTDISLYNFMVFAVTLLTPSIAELIQLRMNAAGIDYFTLLSSDIIKNKRNSLRNSKNGNINIDNNNNNSNTEQEYFRATNFIELLLEAENERIKLENKEFNNSNNDNCENISKTNKAIKYMTNEEIMAQCVLFLMVGYDTTATTITLTLYNLACNPMYQEQLYEEIMSTLKEIEIEIENNDNDNDNDSKFQYKDDNNNNVNYKKQQNNMDVMELFTFEKIQKMKFLESVIKETLRLYPPATFTERVASEDITIENDKQKIYVKKGDVINIPIYSIHRDPRYWNEPDTFNPERFLQPNPTYHKYSYLPFGSGPRDCIAKSLAYFEAKVAVLHAVRMYKFIKCDKTPVPVQFYNQNNLLINKDIHVDIEKR